MNGLPVARLFGFEIRIHLSWILIAALVTVLVVSQLEANAPGLAAPARWVAGAVIAVAFFLSVLAHELGHGIVARRRGLEVGPITVFFFGGSASFELESDRPRDEALVAVAGPVVSLAIAALTGVLAVLAEATGDDTLGAIGLVALVLAALNLILGVANLVPAYPLDGGRLVRAIFWARTGDERRGARAAASSGRYVGWMLVAAGLTVILVGGETADGLMLGLSGWLLGSAARAIDRRLRVQELIADVRVGDVLERDAATVPPGLTVDTFADRITGGAEGSAVPVIRDDRIVGVIGNSQLRRLRRASWATTRAEDVMVEPPSPGLAPGDSLWSALDRLRRTGLDGLPVFDAGAFVGLVTRRLIATTIQDRAKLRGVTIR